MAKQTLEVMASETLSVVDEKIVMLKMVIARLTNSPTALLSSEYFSDLGDNSRRKTARRGIAEHCEQEANGRSFA